MNTITREELKRRLDQSEPVQLVMALGQWAYEQQHIPGSFNLENMAETIRKLRRDQTVIVYDTNPACPASYRAYYWLQSLGFTQISRFVGGIEDWCEAGFPVEGILA